MNGDTILWNRDGVIRIGGTSRVITRQLIDSVDDLASCNWCRRGASFYGENVAQDGRESEDVHRSRAGEIVELVLGDMVLVVEDC